MVAVQNLPRTTESPVTEPGLIHIDRAIAEPEMFSDAESGAFR